MLVLGGWGTAVTAYLNIQYKAPVPLPSTVVVVAKLVEQERRKILITAALTDHHRLITFVSRANPLPPPSPSCFDPAVQPAPALNISIGACS